MATLALQAVGTAIGGPIGGFIGAKVGGLVDSAIFGGSTRLQDVIGPRLDNLKVQTSAYGEFIPQIFGNMRVGGNVIWATDIKEVETRTEQSAGGGKGVGGGETKQTTVTYDYFATLAIAICEGEIDEVVRVWADSKILTIDDLQNAKDKYEVHLGSEEQLPSDIIKDYSADPDNVPAYRGTAYIVIEDFPLADYGNRIPNFNFEVKRTVRPTPSVEDKITAITIIPGSGEFVYSNVPSYKYSVTLDENGQQVKTGTRRNVNIHNFENVANVTLALDQMQAAFPNLEWVSVVCNWFITSSDLATAQVIPKIEDSDNIVEPFGWSVGGYNRGNAQEVLRFENGALTYGGTPSDRSVLGLLQDLKARGYKVMFYPMPLVDTLATQPGETDKPWRGRLVPASEAECSDFFTRANGYNAFIRHYSQLNLNGTTLKALVDAFVIGSEMRGITEFHEGAHYHIGVHNLEALAQLVQQDLAGTGLDVKVTYAADWSEYHSIDGYYHLDHLWASPHIDMVGIDNYMPLTPDLDQSDITEEKIRNGWENDEGWDYYYLDSEARTGKTNYPIGNGLDPYAWKNIEQWWNTNHFHFQNLSNGTGWTPQMKPIWFTEFGFPSVDGAANQPNVFVDPTSVESFYPRGSKRRVDFLAQRQAVNASLDFWQAKNAEAGNAELVPLMFLWTWDARPYPYFPDLRHIWADGGNWRTGHWVTGKFGASNLGAIIANLLAQVGMSPDMYDVSSLVDPVEGFIINNRQTIRAHLEALRAVYFFDVVESNGRLKFIKRGQSVAQTIEHDDLVPGTDDDLRETVTIVRTQELELPDRVDVQYINRVNHYQAANQLAQRDEGSAEDKVTITAPIVFSDAQARSIAESILYAAWIGRLTYQFTLPPKYVLLEPSDVITLNVSGVAHRMRMVETTMARGGQQQVSAISEDISAYDFYTDPGDTVTDIEARAGTAESNVILLDLPALPNDTDDNGTLRAAFATEQENWRGAVLYQSTDGGENGGNNFSLFTSANALAVTGTALNALPAGPRNHWDTENTLRVALSHGALSSTSRLAVLNGANACVLGNEIIQFSTATLVEQNVYELSDLLRGRLGTEHEMANHAVGDAFVLLGSGVEKQTVPLNDIGLLRHYKAASLGQLLANVDEQTFTYAGVKFRPYAPVHITGERDGSDNLTIRWVRRTRINGAWRDAVDVPLGEESERYEVDIMDGATVVRTISSSVTECTYSAAEQVADFGAVQTEVAVRVYQLSAVVGRGVSGDGVV